MPALPTPPPPRPAPTNPGITPSPASLPQTTSRTTSPPVHPPPPHHFPHHFITTSTADSRFNPPLQLVNLNFAPPHWRSHPPLSPSPIPPFSPSPVPASPGHCFNPPTSQPFRCSSTPTPLLVHCFDTGSNRYFRFGPTGSTNDFFRNPRFPVLPLDIPSEASLRTKRAAVPRSALCSLCLRGPKHRPPHSPALPFSHSPFARSQRSVSVPG